MKIIKNLIQTGIFIIACFATFSICSFTSDTSNVGPKKKNTENAGAFVLRWTGQLNNNCVCPSCRCSGCPCPLGICGCGGVRNYSGGDLASDEGTCSVYMESGLLHVKFNQTTALSLPSISNNDIVPVSGNTYLDATLSQALGYSSVMIPNGYYEVDYTNSPYGTITLTPITVPL
ncbi:MAG: hypothetical protein K1X81_01400 [Bacteroidia bacterium]|nr:hypothetical protein [Bacteroidia bacterium]